MDLLELAEKYPQMAITIKAGDLVAANIEIARRVREELESEIAFRAAEIGDRLIPAAQARVMLGNPDKSTLWRWEHKHGYLKSVKIGVKLYYKASDLERIIQAHTIN